MANTGNVTVTERDMNPLSQTYDTTRTRTYRDYTRCIPDGTKLYWTDTNDVGHSYACDSHPAVTGTEWPRTTGTSKLKTVSIGSCATAIGTVATDTSGTSGGFVFEDAVHLVYVTMADSVHMIGLGAFAGCTALETIEMSQGIDTIGEYAFRGCSSLQTIDLPASLLTIYERAFLWCDNLTSITCNATTPPTLDYHVFDFTNDCPIYVPAASVAAYKAATNWSNYASRIQAIPT